VDFKDIRPLSINETRKRVKAVLWRCLYTSISIKKYGR
jgi:hypothetical protein